jgi:hypothetical protein
MQNLKSLQRGVDDGYQAGCDDGVERLFMVCGEIRRDPEFWGDETLVSGIKRSGWLTIRGG